MQEKQTIGEFVQRAQSLHGDRFRQVLIYGSWARNEATEESDIDLAVVLAHDVRPGREIDIITDINLEYSVLLSVYPVLEENYLHANSPLLINLRREGVPA